jgi:hypothetical protein
MAYFKVTYLARELGIDEKVARRRLRNSSLLKTVKGWRFPLPLLEEVARVIRGGA